MAGLVSATTLRRRSLWWAAGFLLCVSLASIASLPWTLGATQQGTAARFEHARPSESLRPPAMGDPAVWLGTDRLGRSLTARLLLGGGISLVVGLAAATTALLVGTSWGLTAALCGGRVDNIMMRIVDVLYGLPSVLLVILLAFAMDGLRARMWPGVTGGGRLVFDLMTLWLAIGAVSWLTLARVVRGQVMSLRTRPFLESARLVGVAIPRQIRRYYLPWLMGPVLACAVLVVPMAMLSEAFLSFLGIGVQEPLPSWGNMAASALAELNPVRSRWWMLLFPCLLIAVTLISLTVLGEQIRMAVDPRSRETA